MGIGGNWDRRAEPAGRLGSIDRRRFMHVSGLSAAALVFGTGPFTEKAANRPRFPGYPFGLGVASGDPAPGGVVLWTRLAPEPLAQDGYGGMPHRKVEVRWEIAADERFHTVLRRGTEAARPELAHSVHVEANGLEPDRGYFYRFSVGSEISPVGRTRTAPMPGSRTRGLSFAFASCQQYEHGYYDAYRHMAQEDLHLVVHLGDYIYEYAQDEYRAPGGNVRGHGSGETTTLPAYRNRHALYRSDADLRAAHAAFPWIVAWDDHEVGNNYADQSPERAHSLAPESFMRRRAAAYQAYYEHMPLRRSSVPHGPQMQLYRRISFGDLATFHVLDTRQYRADQASGDGIEAPTSASRSPDRTVLGERQERWLLDGLGGSSARWNALAQQVFFARVDYRRDSGELLNMDAWDGYPAARQRIVDSIVELRVANPVVLTGDVHSAWANDILSDFDDPGSKVVAAELAGTSITSGGDGSDVKPDTSDTLAENAHLKFFDNRRGYVRCSLTPEQWRADYRTVAYVSRPGSPVSTRASFVVEAGKPGAQRTA